MLTGGPAVFASPTVASTPVLKPMESIAEAFSMISPVDKSSVSGIGKGTSVYGLVEAFVMLTESLTWPAFLSTSSLPACSGRTNLSELA